MHRKMVDWGWYSDPNTKDVFLHLLLTSNWHDSEYLGVTVHRGQCVFGRAELAQKLGISERSVRTAISHLKSTGELSVKTTNRFSVATIVKFNDYQVNDDGGDQQNDQPAVTRATNDRPTTDHIQEYKNNKNIKNIYGEFQNVLLTDQEHEKLMEKLGDKCQTYIERLSSYIASKGTRYKSHYATILNWYRKDGDKQSFKTPVPKTQRPDFSDPERYRNEQTDEIPWLTERGQKAYE